MNTAEFNALPEGIKPTESQREKLFVLARGYRDREDRAYKGFSGSDRAEAPALGMVADVFAAVGQGKDLDAALAFFDSKWRGYAAEVVKKVNDAPKIRRGPSSGHSSIHHRWVSADHFETHARHIRQMTTAIMSEAEPDQASQDTQ